MADSWAHSTRATCGGADSASCFRHGQYSPVACTQRQVGGRPGLTACNLGGSSKESNENFED
jgi:hypothetical protein